MVASEIEFQLFSDNASWTYEMWERLPNDGNRYEIIDGVLYMATAPGFSHGQVVLRLLRYIELPLDKRGIAFGIMAPIGLVMPGNDPVVQSDFLLIRSDRRYLISEDGRIRGVPDLIAEVLSASHANYDVFTKRRAYARAGVPEYWILRPETRDVLVYTEPDTAQSDFNNLRRFATDDELVSATLPIRVAVSEFFQDAVSFETAT